MMLWTKSVRTTYSTLVSDDSPVNTNQQWFVVVAKWCVQCRISSIHSRVCFRLVFKVVIGSVSGGLDRVRVGFRRGFMWC